LIWLSTTTHAPPRSSAPPGMYTNTGCLQGIRRGGRDGGGRGRGLQSALAPR
jgi:hypothetical protein